jgi:hypothetical protein
MPKIGKNLPIFTDLFTDNYKFIKKYFTNFTAVQGKNHVPLIFTAVLYFLLIFDKTRTTKILSYMALIRVA